MLDRLNRLFLRSLRALRDLRRAGVVTINAAQVNIAQQQVMTEAIRVTEVEKQAQIKVQQAEIQRRLRAGEKLKREQDGQGEQAGDEQ